MKKIILTSAVLFTASLGLSQGNSDNWKTTGNTPQPGSFFGTLTNDPIEFRVNNVPKMTLDALGDLKLTSLAGTGSRVLLTDATGVLVSLPAGLPGQFLQSNGTWANLPGGATAWQLVGSNLIATNGGNVGIGTANPTSKLTINGDLSVSSNVFVGGGLVTTSTVSASSKVSTGDIDVGNNLQVNGNSIVNGTATFGNQVNLGGQFSNRSIGYLPPVNNGPGVVTIGPSGTGYLDPNLTCNGYPGLSPQNVTQFMEQVLVAAPPIQNGPPQPLLKMGAFASTSYIDSRSSALTINKGCGEFIYLMGTRVGFGTETPTEKFHFNLGNILVDDGVSNGSNFRMTIKGGQQPGLQIGTNNTTGFDALRIYDQLSNTDKFNVKGSGKTTISTTDSPGLTVNTTQGGNFSYNTLLNVNNDLIKTLVVSSTANNQNGQENLTVYGDGRTIIGDQAGLGNASKLNINTNGGTAISITDLQNGNNTFNMSSNGYTEIKVYNPQGMPVIGQYPRVLTIRDMFYNNGNGRDLFVVNSDGKTYAREVEISSVATFPDYVFDKDYKLTSIPEIEEFIKTHKHLPGFQKGEYYEKNGININEMLIKQQEKIEELTLYIIQLKKEIKNFDELSARVKEMEEKVSTNKK